MIFALLLVSIAHAGILDLDANNIKDGSLTQNGITYRILDDREFTIKYLDNGFMQYRRVIVENLDEIKSLEARIKEVFSKVDDLNYQIDILKEQIAATNEEKSSSLALLTSLEEQRDMYKAELDKLNAEKSKLENKITGNFLFSPQGFQIGVAVFIIILVATIIVKAWQFFMKKETKE
jgi:cell division protein FtsB